MPGLGDGGAERQLSMLAVAQAKAGLDVHVALVHGGRHMQRLLDAGVPVHRIAARGNHDPRIWIKLGWLIRRIDPRIVQTWLPQMDVFGGLAATLAARKWVLSERSMELAYRDRIKDRLLRAAIGARADAIVANSPGGLSYWAGRGSGGNIRTVVPNALALGEIEAATPVNPLAGDDGPGEEFILFAGRFSAEKNLPVLLRALAIIARETETRTVLCGEGPTNREVRSIVHDLGLEDRVMLAGVRTDLWGVMKAAAALVNPSSFEGHPNVVLEGAAARVPLVLSDIGAHRDAIGADSALFFRHDSPEELAAVLLGVLRDHAAAKRRAERARQTAVAHSVERAVQGYSEVYARLLAGR